MQRGGLQAALPRTRPGELLFGAVAAGIGGVFHHQVAEQKVIAKSKGSRCPAQVSVPQLQRHLGKGDVAADSQRPLQRQLMMHGIGGIGNCGLRQRQAAQALKGAGLRIRKVAQRTGHGDDLKGGARRTDPFGCPVPEGLLWVVLVHLCHFGRIKGWIALQRQQLPCPVVHHDDRAALALGKQLVGFFGQPRINGDADVVASPLLPLQGIDQPFWVGLVEGIEVVGHKAFHPIGHIVGTVANRVHQAAPHGFIGDVGALAFLGFSQHQVIAVDDGARGDISLGAAQVVVCA